MAGTRTRNLQCVFWIGVLLGAVPALAVEGRYLGSVNWLEGTEGGDVMRHLYEIGGREPLPRGMNLHLRASFQFQSNLPVRDTDLLRTRLIGELRAPRWRAEGQLMPWQRNTVAMRDSRERQAQFGLHFMPGLGSQFDANYERLERDLAGLRSASESRRLRAALNRNGYGGEVTVRRIDTEPSPGLGAPQRTDEWRGIAHAERSWRQVSAGGDYEGLLSRYTQRERLRTLQTQRLQGQASWTPHRRITATATVHERWGGVEDNAVRFDQPMGERGMTGEFEYRPVNGLNLRALREYNRQDGVGVDLVSDYLQMEARYRQYLWRGVALQTGIMGAEQFSGANADAPRSTAYGSLEGRLHPRMEFHTEVRGSRVRTLGGTGTHWQDLAELRTHPLNVARVDVTWRRDVLPGLDARQSEHEWMVTGAYDPSATTSLSGTLRRLTSEGRLARVERYAAMSANWRPAPRVTFSANGQWRRVAGLGDLGRERVVGLDASFDLPDDFRVRGNLRSATNFGIPERRSYGVSVEKNF